MKISDFWDFTVCGANRLAKFSGLAHTSNQHDNADILYFSKSDCCETRTILSSQLFIFRILSSEMNLAHFLDQKSELVEKLNLDAFWLSQFVWWIVELLRMDWQGMYSQNRMSPIWLMTVVESKDIEQSFR